MQNITVEVVQGNAIEQCRELCNELMAYQKQQAKLHPECFDFMNFDTRMKKSYEGALESQVVVAKDNGVPIGYVFSTVDDVQEEARTAFPSWAPTAQGNIGLYPDWVALPQKIGCLSNLYLREGYRHLGLGAKLYGTAMQWLESRPGVDLTFVYLSNGNDAALKFYLKHGFVFSHDVFGGFIQAAYKKRG